MVNHPATTAQTSTDPGVPREKLTAIADVNSAESLEDQDDVLKSTKSTSGDAAGMKRMGKQQQLVRHFRLVSTVSFVALATAAWEIGLFVITPGLTDGGRAGLVWNVLWNIVGFGPIYLSMAEVSLANHDVSALATLTFRQRRWPAWLQLRARSTTGSQVRI